MLSPLPGAIEPELSTHGIGTPAIAAPTTLSNAAIVSANSHATTSDVEVTSMTSRKSQTHYSLVQSHNLYCDTDESLPTNNAEEQQGVSDKIKKKKSKKGKNKKGKNSKKNAKGKSPISKDTSTAKVPSLKKWAKEEEKKKKAEAKRQKKELKKEKKEEKEMEKRIAKDKKQQEAEKKREEKELKKAEKEEAKAKKAEAKAEKTAAKAKKVAAKAEEKKNKKKSKFESRMQKMMDESDKQMVADVEKNRNAVEEKRRRMEAKAKKMMKKLTMAEKAMKTLQETVERKEKKVSLLKKYLDGKSQASMLVAMKAQFRITNYNRRIDKINSAIAKLKTKIEGKKKEIEKLAPHLLETDVSTQTQELEEAGPSSPSNESDGDDCESVDDDCSILDMLCGLESDSDPEDDLEELTAPEENSTTNVQDILQKAQVSLQKMDKASHWLEEPSYAGKGKEPANGRETVKKFLH